MSTVAEIKDAVSKLPARQKLALARWLQSQTDDRLTDEEMMKIAAEGARALDRREARVGSGVKSSKSEAPRPEKFQLSNTNFSGVGPYETD